MNKIRAFVSDALGHNKPEGIRGLLLAYVVLLGYLFFHGLGLTIASIIIYANPSLVHMTASMSLGHLIVYVAANVIELVYIVVLFALFFKKRKSSIINNIIFSILSIVIIILFHLLGEKSNIGTFIDALPGVAGVFYFLLSKRVKNTFILN